LFVRLTAIYGQLWLGKHPNEVLITTAKREWTEALAKFDNQAIKEALIEYRAKHRFPPNLPEFVACCREKLARKQVPINRNKSKQKSSPDIASFHIKKMLASLTTNKTRRQPC